MNTNKPDVTVFLKTQHDKATGDVFNTIAYDSNELTKDIPALVNYFLSEMSEYLKSYSGNDIKGEAAKFFESFNQKLTFDRGPYKSVAAPLANSNPISKPTNPIDMVNALLELFELKNTQCKGVSANAQPINIDRTETTPLLIKGVCPMIKGTTQEDAQEFLSNILENLPDEVMNKTFKIESPTQNDNRQNDNRHIDINPSYIRINLGDNIIPRDYNLDSAITDVVDIIDDNKEFKLNNYIIFYVQPKTFKDHGTDYISLPDKPHDNFISLSDKPLNKSSSNPVAANFYTPPNRIYINNHKETYRLYSIVYKIGREVRSGHYTNRLFNTAKGNVYMDDEYMGDDDFSKKPDPSSSAPTIVIYKKNGIITEKSDSTDSSPFPLSTCLVPLANPNGKLANSCFINTVMQSLWYNDELYAALKEYAIAKGGNATRRKSNRKKSKRRKSKRTRKI